MSFTVKNMCDISGSGYAENYFDHISPTVCSLILPNPSEAFGPPNASGTSNSEYSGFVSLNHGGSVGFEMGRTVVNGPGNDIRVYEYVSDEPLEALVAQSELGPWISLGALFCGDSYCEFDLGRSGINYARFVKIVDMWSAAASCYATAGSDIDAVVGLNVASDAGQCAVY